MKLRLLISLVSINLALVAQRVCAQSADDFFHTGAQAYLTNNTASAREQVDKGLKLYPTDTKLKKLDELLKQQQQQQNQQQQQQKQQQQQQQNQQNQSQSKQDQQKQQDQKKQDEQKKQDQQKKDQKDQQDQDQDKRDDKQQPKEQPTPGEMSPDEAKNLLDSQKGDEKLLPANQDKKHDRNRQLKDW